MEKYTSCHYKNRASFVKQFLSSPYDTRMAFCLHKGDVQSSFATRMVFASQIMLHGSGFSTWTMQFIFAKIMGWQCYLTTKETPTLSFAWVESKTTVSKIFGGRSCEKCLHTCAGLGNFYISFTFCAAKFSPSMPAFSHIFPAVILACR